METGPIAGPPCQRSAKQSTQDDSCEALLPRLWCRARQKGKYTLSLFLRTAIQTQWAQLNNEPVLGGSFSSLFLFFVCLDAVELELLLNHWQVQFDQHASQTELESR